MTSKSRTHGKVASNDCWLNDDRFKLWLKKGQDCNKAVCSSCNNAVIDIATMGVCALTSLTKEPNTKKESGILILLLFCFLKEIKQVFRLLQVVLQNKVMLEGELIQ